MEDKITKLLNLLSANPELSINLRLFFVTERGFVRIYYGHCSTTSYAQEFGFVRNLIFVKSEDQGQLIDLFSKLEFFVNEFIQLKLLGLNAQNGKKLEDFLEEVNFDSKVALLKQWGIIDKKLRGKIKKVTDVRNSLAHVYDISNVFYPERLSGEKVPICQAFDDFKEDFEDVWKGLIEIYKKQQEEFDIDTLIHQIQEGNPQ